MTSLQSWKTIWRNLAKEAVEPFAPIGVLVHINWVARKGRVKADHGLDSSANESCQNDPDRSSEEKNLGLLLPA